MRRLFEGVVRAMKWLIAVPVLLIAAVLIAANTDPGRHLIETLTPQLTGGAVRIQGLAGRFPDAIRIQRLEVADDTGVWLTVTDASLDWRPRRLIGGRAEIDRLDAAAVAVHRLPAPSESSGSTTYPVRSVALRRLHVARLEIGAALAGQAAVLTVDGTAEIATAGTGQAHFTATNTGKTPPADQNADRYMIDAMADGSNLRASVEVREAPHGLLAVLAGLPDLGAIVIGASVDGPWSALKTQVTVGAGSLRANVEGSMDAVGRTADLRATATAPAMEPAPGISWSSVDLDAQASGPLTAPAAAGTLKIAGLTAGGVKIGLLTAGITGTAGGPLTLHATLAGTSVPGPRPDLFGQESLTLDAAVRPDGSLRFAALHHLVSVEGTVETTPAQRVEAKVTVPDLTPFASLGGVDLLGGAVVNIDASRSNDTIAIAANGTAGITGGMKPVPGLIGDTGVFDLKASMRGGEVTITRLAVSGKSFDATARGTVSPTSVALDWMWHLPSLAEIQPSVSGTAEMRGTVSGTFSNLSLTGDLTARVAANGYEAGDITASVAVDGLPDDPSARLSASGTILDAPLSLALTAARRSDGVHVMIERGAWKSMAAAGHLDLPTGATVPVGKIELTMNRLADLAPLIGRPVTGSVSASLEGSDGTARLLMKVRGGAIPGTASVTEADVTAIVSDIAGTPAMDAVAVLNGIEAGGTRGSMRLTAKGTASALPLRLSLDLPDVKGAPVRLDATATVNADREILALETMTASWKRETLRLLAPSRVGFARGVSIDRMRLGLRGGTLEISGRASDTLDLRVVLANLPVDIAAVIAPEYAADGLIAGDVHLTGTAASPEGTIVIKATGLRSRAPAARGLPATNMALTVALKGAAAHLDGRVVAGTSIITLAGSMAIQGEQRLDLRVGGTIDLAIANGILASQGQYVRGRLSMDLGIGGSVTTPRATGSVRLTGGEFQDTVLGVRISNTDALATCDGDTIRLDRLAGKAGDGSIFAAGTAGLTGPRRLEFTLRADNARLLTSDLVVAVADANLTLNGTIGGPLAVTGTVLARHAEVRVPERLPSSVAVIQVREAGKPWVQPPARPSPDIALNVTLDSPRAIYIRGRGLDVELGGRTVFKGTAARPLPEGGLRLRRGTIGIAGKSLTMTEGTIDFANADITNPSLKLVAMSRSSALTATLTVSGDVSDPRIVLSSVPDLPQDEILSQLLFNTARARLSPFQVAQIAAAIASLSGAGSSFGDPLAKVRAALGLDQLSIGSGSNGGATLQVGRYLAPGVRLGVQQSASGGGSQATVQIDIARGLKLETSAGSGAAPSAGVGQGGSSASVGIKYEFEY